MLSQTRMPNVVDFHRDWRTVFMKEISLTPGAERCLGLRKKANKDICKMKAGTLQTSLLQPWHAFLWALGFS